MLIIDLIQSFLNADFWFQPWNPNGGVGTALQVCSSALAPGESCVCSGFSSYNFGFFQMFGAGNSSFCPGSAFTPIAAAYQTQGMWVQADLIAQIMYTKLGSLASLIYVIAAIGGLIGVAIGAPPKMYLWFFMGPPIFHWLLGATYPIKGTHWVVANQVQDQREVWKLAEVGLLNSNWIVNARNVYKNKEPGGSVDVSLFFVVWDDLVSGTIQNLISWTGMFRMRQSPQADADTTVGKYNSATTLSVPLDKKWFLLSNSKWEMVENITGAKFANPNVRDFVVNFFAGECGASFLKQVDQGAFVNALYGRGRTAPTSIFEGVVNSATEDPLTTAGYPNLATELAGKWTVVPRSLKNLIKDRGKYGSYHEAFSWPNKLDDRIQRTDAIRCDLYFQLVSNAFRWESGHIYHQFMRSAPKGLNEDQVIFNLLYGWDVNKVENGTTRHLTAEESSQFLANLILVHLIRNEVQIISFDGINLYDTTADSSFKSAAGHLRYVATKNKYQEVYQWAKMIPHMQGVLLYYLALAYPFACLMVIMPGQHKMLFTWMSFWAWAKLWDLGFAVVTALERSVWATIGNNSDIRDKFERVAALSTWGTTLSSGILSTGIQSTTAGGGTPQSCGENIENCPFANVIISDCVGSGGGLVCTSKAIMGDAAAWLSSTKIFDRSIALASNLDLDLSNSYYIYIMAGLYFAVPVVTGQMVLGAKAGATSFVNNIIGAVGQEAGRQGAAAYQSDAVYRMKANMASTGQAAWLKAMKDQISPVLGADGKPMVDADGNPITTAQAGLAGRQMGLSNAHATAQTRQAAAGSRSKMNSQGANAYFLGKQGYDAANQAEVALLDALFGGSKKIGGTTPGAPGEGTNGDPQAQRGTGTGKSGNAGTPGAPEARSDDPGWLKKYKAAATMGSRMQLLDGYDNSAKADAANSRLEAAGFGFGGQSTMYGQAEGRFQRYGNYEGEMAAWEARNAFANQFNQQASALGLFAGGLDPGNKPTDSVGMAMSGELGSASHMNSWYMAPQELQDKDGLNFGGGFFADVVKPEQAVLDSKADDVGNAYMHWAPSGTIAPNLFATGQVAGSNVAAVVDLPSQVLSGDIGLDKLQNGLVEPAKDYWNNGATNANRDFFNSGKSGGDLAKQDPRSAYNRDKDLIDKSK